MVGSGYGNGPAPSIKLCVMKGHAMTGWTIFGMWMLLGAIVVLLYFHFSSYQRQKVEEARNRGIPEVAIVIGFLISALLWPIMIYFTIATAIEIWRLNRTKAEVARLQAKTLELDARTQELHEADEEMDQRVEEQLREAQKLIDDPTVPDEEKTKLREIMERIKGDAMR